MDAVKYLETRTRLTAMDKNGMCQIDCYDCPLSVKNNDEVLCTVFEALYPEKAVAVVEKWAAEHPVKTRQSEFKEKYPYARLDEFGVLFLKPCDMDTIYKPRKGCATPCDDCRKEYWSQEVDDEQV